LLFSFVIFSFFELIFPQISAVWSS
jgi:hypothetical protein